jgi:hypothetical protein
VSVDAATGVLLLGGVDVVDGSPVLDIKPYVPFSDALADATAPDWVTVSYGCNRSCSCTLSSRWYALASNGTLSTKLYLVQDSQKPGK